MGSCTHTHTHAHMHTHTRTCTHTRTHKHTYKYKAKNKNLKPGIIWVSVWDKLQTVKERQTDGEQRDRAEAVGFWGRAVGLPLRWAGGWHHVTHRGSGCPKLPCHLPPPSCGHLPSVPTGMWENHIWFLPHQYATLTLAYHAKGALGMLIVHVHL